MEINVNEYLKSMQFMDQLVKMVTSVYPDKFMLSLQETRNRRM